MDTLFLLTGRDLSAALATNLCSSEKRPHWTRGYKCHVSFREASGKLPLTFRGDHLHSFCKSDANFTKQGKGKGLTDLRTYEANFQKALFLPLPASVPETFRQASGVQLKSECEKCFRQVFRKPSGTFRNCSQT